MILRQFVRFKSTKIPMDKLSEEVKSQIAKFRNKVQIVESEIECKEITDKLNSCGKAIAVDLEAVQKSQDW